MLGAILHTLHVILAGAWLGGVVFTTTVVSPALKSMGWDEAERARVRSVIGRQYAKVGTANLVLLLGFALWIRFRSLLRVRAVGRALWARGFLRGLLRETPGGAGRGSKRGRGFRKGPHAGSQAAEVAEALLRDLHAEHTDQCGGRGPCNLHLGRVKDPMPHAT